ncbi:hypothetical protein ACIQZB_37150 [Streptomyces sp. NPDC097727]|uniref:hypothetical protein n=1 Tax=Streptomyces sp. NPDC097727 TaxID=3366092 RepID=UPI0038115726
MITTPGDLTADRPGDSADELPDTPVHDVTVIGAAHPGRGCAGEVARRDGRVLHRQRLLLPAAPGRPFHLRADLPDRPDRVDPHGTAVRIAAR